MARPVVLTLTGDGATTTYSEIAVLDWHLTPFNVGMGFSDSGSSTSFTVQYTFENEQDYASKALFQANAVWYDHPFMAAMTANTSGNFAYTVAAVRLKANGTGTDTGKLRVIQAGLMQ